MRGSCLRATRLLGRCLEIRPSSRRCLGTGQSFDQEKKLNSNMLLSVDTLLTGADLRVNIAPQWNDDCSIHHFSQRGATLETKKYDNDGWSLASASDKTNEASLSTSEANEPDRLDINLPERCNLRLHVRGPGFCTVDVRSKLEGDVDIALDHGDIQVNKIRGPNVNFRAGEGRVLIKTVAEGDLRVTATELQAKTLQGPALALDVEGDIDVRAAYAGEIRATSGAGKVTLGTVHAPTLTCTAPGGVSVDALKGDAALTSSRGDVRAHFDSQGPDGRSTVVANAGDVALSVQLFAAVDVDFSAQEISFPAPSVGSVTFDGHQRLADPMSGGLSAAEGRYHAHGAGDADATRSSGKISLEGRQAAASLGRGSDGGAVRPANRFAIAASAGKGRVELRIGSWIENMRRKLKF